MYPLLYLAIFAFLLTLLLTPLVRALARRWTPNHTTPGVGGIAIVLSYLV